ncbi:MAG: hypothetical protein N0A16_12810 [Blastocatellia bacterium]|nr:hypothetical protein [Blastocatellia bacterium]MCS7158591.1 hypothetical protein [Blastocatellia bacterium]MDW8169283.1 hypothetical protein [Acidobacteriota bacterium]MDW8257787.1 hypothetical protein [Acidobacteriota bacterium]
MVIPQRLIYAYPWDLKEEGIETALATIADLGLTAVSVAVSYHSGKFLSPRHPHRRVIFPEGGVIYFHPSEARFRDLPIRPVVSELVRDEDVLAEIMRACSRYGLRFIGWVVGTHNSRLGMRHPEFLCRNAYGDPYVYALCPSHEAVRAFLLVLVEDVLEQYPLDGLEVESFGYLGFLHGYHHEFYSVSLGIFEQALLALCFCSACEQMGKEAGLDVKHLRESVRQTLDRRLNGSVERGLTTAADDVAALLDFLLAHVELQTYLKRRNERVTSLLVELAALTRRKGVELSCSGPVFARPTALGWVEGLDLRAVGTIVDRFVVALYFEEEERRMAEAAFIADLQLPCALGAALNLGHPYTRAVEEVERTIRYVANLGFTSVGFYNYGTLPIYRLQWIQRALTSLEGR